jgi:hypothetical protein
VVEEDSGASATASALTALYVAKRLAVKCNRAAVIRSADQVLKLLVV